MKHSENIFRGYQNLALYTQQWHPDNPDAILIIVHGFGEHSGRYMNVVNKLLPEGFSIYSFDHRGHGRSPGNRGHVMSWKEYITDVKLFIEYVRGQQKGLPVFLMGHSMGGMIVLNYAIKYPDRLEGVISSAPLLAQPAISPLLVFLSRILSKIWPGFAIDTKLDVNLISRDTDVVKAYQEDPLVHSMASARFGTEMQAARKWTLENAGEFNLPLLILHGEADKLVPEHGSAAFFERAGTEDKVRHLYPEGQHEPHNDIDREKVLKDLEEWLDKHR